MSKLISAKEARSNMNRFLEENNGKKEESSICNTYIDYVYDMIKKTSEEGEESILIDIDNVNSVNSDKLIYELKKEGYNVNVLSHLNMISVSWTLYDEDALLKDLENVNSSLIGRIYKIKSYALTEWKEYIPFSSNLIPQYRVPHMVIGINHDGTEDTIDLMQMVTPIIIKFHNKSVCGNYFLSDISSYLINEHIYGYSKRIESHMLYMKEVYREPDPSSTDKIKSVMKSRHTKCKLLNPVEVYGPRSLDVMDPTYSDLDIGYGQMYEAFIKDPMNRLCYKDLECRSSSWYWLNSFAKNFDGSANGFTVSPYANCFIREVDTPGLIAPVIRLSLK